MWKYISYRIKLKSEYSLWLDVNQNNFTSLNMVEIDGKVWGSGECLCASTIALELNFSMLNIKIMHIVTQICKSIYSIISVKYCILIETYVFNLAILHDCLSVLDVHQYNTFINL